MKGKMSTDKRVKQVMVRYVIICSFTPHPIGSSPLEGSLHLAAFAFQRQFCFIPVVNSR